MSSPAGVPYCKIAARARYEKTSAKVIVTGYLHEIQRSAPYLRLPMEIIYLCISFYFLVSHFLQVKSAGSLELIDLQSGLLKKRIFFPNPSKLLLFIPNISEKLRNFSRQEQQNLFVDFETKAYDGFIVRGRALNSFRLYIFEVNNAITIRATFLLERKLACCGIDSFMISGSCIHMLLDFTCCKMPKTSLRLHLSQLEF